MSRVIWGHGEKNNGDSSSSSTNNHKKQTTLDAFVKPMPTRRDRVEDDTSSLLTGDLAHTNDSAQQLLQQAIHQSVANGEDGVQWGPSGGRDRETQRMRKQRPFMLGRERSAALDKSPYSRDFIKEWQGLRTEQESEWKKPQQQQQQSAMAGRDRKVKGEVGDGIKTEIKNEVVKKEEWADDDDADAEDDHPQPKVFMATSAKGTTEMDPALIAGRFVGPNCPRDLFRGKCFFLNSCDADPLISVYQLEKVIRFLGGSTAMGVSTRVSYVLTQHLSSAKEARLLRDFDEVRGLDTNGTRKQPANASGMKTVNAGGGDLARRFPKCVHPHFVIACCREGRIVPLDGFLTTPKCLLNNNGIGVVKHEQQQQQQQEKGSAKDVHVKNKATQQQQRVVNVDDDDDNEKVIELD